MNEKIKEFLDAKKEAENEISEQEKQKTLIELGLYEKVYSPDNKHSEEFSQTEWDNEFQTYKYYKIVPFEITDEEYQEVKKYSLEEDTTESNPVASVLTVIAWILFIGGFVVGIVIGTTEAGYYSDFSFGAAFACWVVAFISGIMFLSFAEIIKLLVAIKNK